MCGIAGFAGKGRLFQGAPDRILQDMTDRIESRGPDAQGHWISDDKRVAFGHRRLSIVDLSPTGAQPMTSASGRLTITYNGEIYNAPELRNLFQSHHWKGSSDTEVLLELIELHGVETALSMVDGMFGFALYDRADKSLTLVRDPFGEKPLYWGWVQGQLIFASQLSAFHPIPEFKAEIDERAVATYFKYSYVPDPHSIFKSVNKLQPGHLLKIDLQNPDQSATPICYWNPTDQAIATPRFEGSFEDAKAELLGVLKTSVKRRMMSDVPLGALLSGGIDSSLTVALVQSLAKNPVKTFTIGMPVEGFNEAELAKAVADHLGTDHTELMLSGDDIRNSIQKMGEVYDEPFSDSSQVPTYLVSQLARKDVTVALSGDGADELFAGYNRHFKGPSLWRKARRIPYPLRRAVCGGIDALPNGMLQQLGRLSGSSELSSGRSVEKIRKFLRTFQAKSMPDFLDRLQTTGWQGADALCISKDIQPFELSADIDGLPFAQASMLNDTSNYLPGDILTKTDRASMAVGLELRTPYLSRDLFDFAWSLPERMKMQNGQGKSILRSILYDFVPQDLVDRPKAGFAIPLGRWMASDLSEWVGDLLSPNNLQHSSFYHTEFVTKCWNEHRKGTADHESFLWSILMFESWKSNLSGELKT